MKYNYFFFVGIGGGTILFPSTEWLIRFKVWPIGLWESFDPVPEELLPLFDIQKPPTMFFIIL
ncbi:hypothetical protein B14911_10902 [Bacillus sp. NRRL B-14911]|nr:hypothetical protein B14911_10902 [Bacillus sp. NRRL B-14911]